MEKIPHRFPTKFMDLPNGEKLAYRENSEKVSIHILALHGQMNCSLTFEPLMEKLEKIAHVVAPCFRGMGFSKISYRIKSLEDLAEDLLLFYNQLPYDQIYILGFEIGAIVALHLSLKLPQKTKGLILLNP